MKFRPCIDIHNGKVKQIVGGSLAEDSSHSHVQENFVSEQNAAFYAEYYKHKKVKGGHIILLNSRSSEYYESTRKQAMEALQAFPGGLQAGGGITDETAYAFLDAGASHVIVTSYVFRDGGIYYENLCKMIKSVGKNRLVLDLSCRFQNGAYYIVTDRWQKFTDTVITQELLKRLSESCDEFLIHAVDVEGKASGIELPLVKILSGLTGVPVTYAGGIGCYEDLIQLKEYGRGRLDATIGSALDLFGGPMEFEKILELCEN